MSQTKTTSRTFYMTMTRLGQAWTAQDSKLHAWAIELAGQVEQIK